MELEFGESAAFDLVVIQEDVALGERVRSYRLEVRDQGAWREIAAGTCIGHKRIHRLEQPVQGDALRLVIDESIAVPRLLRLAISAR
jgi:alpha-L-fucosidase